MPTDIEIYCQNVAVVRDRINKIQTIVAGKMNTGDGMLDAELIFLQFRKVIEGLVYALLSANKTEYAAVHAKFGSHWRAKDMLAEIEKVNADFYPIPLLPWTQVGDIKHFNRVPDGVLTRDDLVLLYDSSSELLHARNPYSTKPKTINLKYTVEEWVSRFQKLLSIHTVQLVSGDMWTVQLTGEGPVRAWHAALITISLGLKTLSNGIV